MQCLKCLGSMSWVRVFISVRAGHRTQLQLALSNTLKTYCWNIVEICCNKYILKCFLPQRELDIGLSCSWHCLILLKTYFEIMLEYVETNNLLKCFLPQRELDIGLGCSWHVVVGEAFSFSVDFEQVLHCILTSSKSSNSFWSLRSLHFDFE